MNQRMLGFVFVAAGTIGLFLAAGDLSPQEAAAFSRYGFAFSISCLAPSVYRSLSSWRRVPASALLVSGWSSSEARSAARTAFLRRIPAQRG